MSVPIQEQVFVFHQKFDDAIKVVRGFESDAGDLEARLNLISHSVDKGCLPQYDDLTSHMSENAIPFLEHKLQAIMKTGANRGPRTREEYADVAGALKFLIDAWKENDYLKNLQAATKEAFSLKRDQLKAPEVDKSDRFRELVAVKAAGWAQRR